MLLAIMVACTFGISAAALANQPDPPASKAVDRSTTSEGGKQDAEDGLSVVAVMGDSFTGGSDMDSGKTWIDLLAQDKGWVLDKDAVGGTGYLTAGPGNETFPVRSPGLAKFSADLIIIAGGANDSSFDDAVLPVAKVVKAAGKVLDDAETAASGGTVVLLSPFVGGDPDSITLAERDGLRDLAKNRDIPFVDVTGVFAGPAAKYIGSDHTHPTDAGHRYLANFIGRELDRLKVPQADAWQASTGR